jgi:prepilin-type N-terminal cleavage/methylation domain-containing protein
MDCAVIYYSYKMRALPPQPRAHVDGGFTLLEAIVGIALIGIGVSCTVGALTKLNSIAAAARNATGAYTAVMNQVDLIQSDGPFNPQKTNPDGTAQIPPELQLGSHTQNGVSIYQDPKTGVILSGMMTTAVSDISSTYTNGSTTFPLTAYKAVVTINYTYLSRNYSFSMSTIRTSDI